MSTHLGDSFNCVYTQLNDFVTHLSTHVDISFFNLIHYKFDNYIEMYNAI
jgi:hypothetical protein